MAELKRVGMTPPPAARDLVRLGSNSQGGGQGGGSRPSINSRTGSFPNTPMSPNPMRLPVPGTKYNGLRRLGKALGKALGPAGLVAATMDALYKATDYKSIPYTGSSMGPNFTVNPYATPIPPKKDVAAPKQAVNEPKQDVSASTPAPQQPGSIPDMGRQGRAQGKAMRDPDSYLGSAFDATLRKGIDTGRNYLQSQMNKDGLDSDDQSKIMARFNDKIADDKELSKASNKSGIVNTIEAKDAGRGQRTLAAYRQQSPQGTYGKGAKAAEIQRKFVK